MVCLCFEILRSVDCCQTTDIYDQRNPSEWRTKTKVRISLLKIGIDISKHCDDGYRCGVKDITSNSLVCKHYHYKYILYWKYLIENLELLTLWLFPRICMLFEGSLERKNVRILRKVIGLGTFLKRSTSTCYTTCLLLLQDELHFSKNWIKSNVVEKKSLTLPKQLYEVHTDSFTSLSQFYVKMSIFFFAWDFDFYKFLDVSYNQYLLYVT